MYSTFMHLADTFI